MYYQNKVFQPNTSHCTHTHTALYSTSFFIHPSAPSLIPDSSKRVNVQSQFILSIFWENQNCARELGIDIPVLKNTDTISKFSNFAFSSILCFYVHVTNVCITRAGWTQGNFIICAIFVHNGRCTKCGEASAVNIRLRKTQHIMAEVPSKDTR